MDIPLIITPSDPVENSYFGENSYEGKPLRLGSSRKHDLIPEESGGGGMDASTTGHSNNPSEPEINCAWSFWAPLSGIPVGKNGGTELDYHEVIVTATQCKQGKVYLEFRELVQASLGTYIPGDNDNFAIATILA